MNRKSAHDDTPRHLPRMQNRRARYMPTDGFTCVVTTDEWTVRTAARAYRMSRKAGLEPKDALRAAWIVFRIVQRKGYITLPL